MDMRNETFSPGDLSRNYLHFQPFADGSVQSEGRRVGVGGVRGEALLA